MPIKKQHVKCDFKDSRPLRIFIYVPIISAENNSKRYDMYYIGIKFHMTCTEVQTSTNGYKLQLQFDCHSSKHDSNRQVNVKVFQSLDEFQTFLSMHSCAK